MNRVLFARYILHGVLVLFSLCVLALCAALLARQSGFDVTFVPVHQALAMAIAILTLIVVIPSHVINYVRRGAFTSIIFVEIIWAGLLTVLWIAAAGQTSAQVPVLNCNGDIGVSNFRDDLRSDFQSICNEEQALMAFAWLNFIILLAWTVTLTAVTAAQHSKGYSTVWRAPVTEVDFLANKGTARNYPPSGNHTSGYPPNGNYNTGTVQV